MTSEDAELSKLTMTECFLLLFTTFVFRVVEFFDPQKQLCVCVCFISVNFCPRVSVHACTRWTSGGCAHNSHSFTTVLCLVEFWGLRQLSHHISLCVFQKPPFPDTHTHTHYERNQMMHSQKHKHIFHLKIPDG